MDDAPYKMESLFYLYYSDWSGYMIMSPTIAI